MPFSGTTVTTGSLKGPYPGLSARDPLGLEGNVQADPSVHGGIDKAVYAYVKEHHRSWEILVGL